MPSAIWSNHVIDEAPESKVGHVEGNIYLPLSRVRREFLRPGTSHTFCHWKGEASYYDVVVDGQTNTDAAWYYAQPLPATSQIKNHVAFWHGVRVEN